MKRVTMTLAIVVVLGIGGASGALGDTLSSALDDFAVISGTIRGKSVSRQVVSSIQHTAYRSDSESLNTAFCLLSTLPQQGKGSYGLFLKRPDDEGGGFREEGERLREALGKARVKFYFTHVQD